jgi:hypothetical protein
LDAIVSPLSMKLAGDLSQWVLRKLDDRQERLAGAQRAAEWLVDHLKRLESDAARMTDGLGRQAATLSDALRRDPRAAAATGHAAFAKALAYFRMRIDHQAVWASTLIARRLLAELKLAGTTVAEFGRHLKHLAVNLPGASGEDSDAVTKSPLAAALAEQRRTMSDEIDGQLQEQFIDGQGGLFPTIMGNSRIRAQMVAALGKLARRAAEQLASRPDVLNSAFADLSPDKTPSDETLPFLVRGGVYRKLTVVPAKNRVRPRLERLGLVSLATAPGHDVVWFVKGWRLPLVLAMTLIQMPRL